MHNDLLVTVCERRFQAVSSTNHMQEFTPSRRLALLILLTGLGSCLHLELRADAQHMRPPAAQPHHNAEAQAPAAQAQHRFGANPAANQPGRGPKGEHLAEWMNQHRELSPGQQQQALEKEPGFNQLPAQTQQRMRDRLAQLNAMSPEQRQRVLKNNEHMETLSPDQRGQVRGAMQQLGALPPDQRRAVARSFRELRDLPADQRSAAMSRLPLNDAQRSTLGNLIRVEPLLPPPEPAQPH
jgi:ATP-dependent exoDNAse (exonuclease V) alpha subunit